MKLEQIEAAIKESLDEYGCGSADEDNLPEELTLVDDGDWEQDYKYQHRSDVYKCDEGNYFMVHNTRSGSPFSDWNYNPPSVQQVKRTEQTVVQVVWVAV